MIEEWPTDGKVGETMRVKTTTHPPEPKTIALKTIKTTSDLQSMKKKDPFLYYSIPGVRSSNLLSEEVDMNSLGTNRIRSCGSFTQRHGAYQPLETVSRSRRISFESHPDLLNIQDLAINDEEGADGELSSLGADASGGLNQEDEDLLDIIFETYSNASVS